MTDKTPLKQDAVRAFIAVEIDATVRDKIAGLLGNLQKGVQFTGAHPKWVLPELMHLTLYFLGNTSPERIEQLKKSLARPVATQSSFEAEFSGLGVFPNPKRPSVLWVGVDRGKRYLRELHQEVMASLLPLGYKPERQPFHPHLTLARIKSMRGTAGLRDVIEAHRQAECGRCPITRVVLFRSELHKAGPVYTPLHAWPLGQSQ